MERGQSNRIPESAAALGYAGALPFVLAAAGVWMLDESARPTAIAVLLGFALMILSFMGGVRWGLAMRFEGGPTFPQLLISVIPAAIAFVVYLTGVFWGQTGPVLIAQFVILIVAFAGLLWSDFLATRQGEAPSWYPGLRVPLTILVEASLVAALVRVALFS